MQVVPEEMTETWEEVTVPCQGYLRDKTLSEVGWKDCPAPANWLVWFVARTDGGPCPRCRLTGADHCHAHTACDVHKNLWALWGARVIELGDEKADAVRVERL